MHQLSLLPTQQSSSSASATVRSKQSDASQPSFEEVFSHKKQDVGSGSNGVEASSSQRNVESLGDVSGNVDKPVNGTSEYASNHGKGGTEGMIQPLDGEESGAALPVENQVLPLSINSDDWQLEADEGDSNGIGLLIRQGSAALPGDTANLSAADEAKVNLVEAARSQSSSAVQSKGEANSTVQLGTAETEVNGISKGLNALAHEIAKANRPVLNDDPLVSQPLSSGLANGGSVLGSQNDALSGSSASQATNMGNSIFSINGVTTGLTENQATQSASASSSSASNAVSNNAVGGLASANGTLATMGTDLVSNAKTEAGASIKSDVAVLASATPSQGGIPSNDQANKVLSANPSVTNAATVSGNEKMPSSLVSVSSDTDGLSEQVRSDVSRSGNGDSTLMTTRQTENAQARFADMLGAMTSGEVADGGDSATPKIELVASSAQAKGPDAKSAEMQSTRPYVSSLALPVTDNEWANQLGQKLMWMGSRNIQSAELHLNPADLGPIEVRIQIGNDQSSINFNTQNASVRELLEANIHRLREMMASSNNEQSDQGFEQRAGQEQSQSYAQGNGSERQSDGAMTANSLHNELNDGQSSAAVGAVTANSEASTLVDAYV